MRVLLINAARRLLDCAWGMVIDLGLAHDKPTRDELNDLEAELDQVEKGGE